MYGYILVKYKKTYSLFDIVPYMQLLNTTKHII